MKYTATFLLMCGLTASVWGQSAPKNQKPVLMKCVALSCSSSPWHRADQGVKVGTFYSFPAVAFAADTRVVKVGTFKSRAMSSRPVVLQVSRVEKEQKMEIAVAKTGAFPVSTVMVRR